MHGLIKDHFCAIEGCQSDALGDAGGKLVCTVHYQRWKRIGQFHLPDRRLSLNGICTAPGCKNVVVSVNKAYCSTHSYRIRRKSKLGLRPIGGNCERCSKLLKGNQSRFCSPICNWRALRGTPDTRECIICKTIYPIRGQSLTCSDDCDDLRSLIERRARMRKEMASEEGRDKRRRYHARRRARKYNARCEGFSDSEIFRRDGWICQICDTPVDRKSKWPQPLTPSVDHIIPLAAGGQHTRGNVHCTHLVCNLRKHTKPLKKMGAPAWQ